MFSKINHLIYMTITLICSSAVLAETPIPLFQSEEPIEIEIKGDFLNHFPLTWKTHRKELLQFSPGTISYKENGDLKSIPIEFKKRGKSRAFDIIPQLMIKFGKEISLQNTPWENAYKKIKLVSHRDIGKNDMDPHEDLNQKVIKEYLNYKLINALGIPSLLTRLVKVKYLDNKFGEFARGYGILLEHKRDASKRLGLEYVKWTEEFENRGPSIICTHIPGSNYYDYTLPHNKEFPVQDLLQTALANVMLKNRDWWPGHNTILAVHPEKGNVLIPYDFNESSLVDDYQAYLWIYSELDLSTMLSVHLRSGKKILMEFLQPRRKELGLPGSSEAFEKPFQEVMKSFIVKKEAVFNEVEKLKSLLTESVYEKYKQWLEKYFKELDRATRDPDFRLKLPEKDKDDREVEVAPDGSFRYKSH